MGRKRGEFPGGYDRSSVTGKIGFVKSIAAECSYCCVFVYCQRVSTAEFIILRARALKNVTADGSGNMREGEKKVCTHNGSFVKDTYIARDKASRRVFSHRRDFSPHYARE